ncbi:MAG: diaminopimelate decarboxylase [Anaerolineaceae bacterium]|nr:diaminopimelate decarboxylase [Anaerolineaceae bacterium]
MTGLLKLLPESAGQDQAGCLIIAGYSLRALAAKYGTPLYLYDQATLSQQVQRLNGSLQRNYPGDWQIAYAAKAYFSLGIARRLAAYGLGVDVVSQGEMAVARRAGFLVERIHLHGNNKSVAELSAALDWNVQSIVVDSLDELDLLESLAEEKKCVARIWLRISPDVLVDTHSYLQTAHSASKFGLGIQNGQAGVAIDRARMSRWLNLTGLHAHLGSQFRQPEPYREAIHRLYALADAHHFIPQEISPGGGWGVSYLPDQAEDNPEPWISTVSVTLQEECVQRGWQLPRLVVEPGRWLVARAGAALYTVGATKTAADGTRFIAVDGGMADNPRPALYDARYTACLPEHMNAAPLHQYSVVGKFCESGDKLIPEVWLPEARRGDLLLIPVAGAYQLSMASNYNLAPRPAVLWLEPGHVEVLQRREQPDESGWWLGE